jgi:hypothetical protein
MIPQLHAGASNKNGNPYGNGTFFDTTGTFSAVVRGENLSGTILFSTGVSTNGSSTNSSGSSVIVFQGNTYMGNSDGMWNPSSGTITGQIWGGQSLSGSNGTTIYPEIFNTNNYPVPINVVSNVVIPPTSGTVSAGGVVIPGSPGTNYSVTNTIYVEPVGTNVVQDGVYMNGSFDGNVQNSYPNQTFTAYGTLTQQQLAQTTIMGTNAALNGGYSNGGPPTANNVEGTTPVQVSSINIPITVQGIRVADTFTSFNTVNNQSNVPYSATYYTMTNIPGQQGGL